ncbi:hypothetical protein BDN70DRAFT_902486 [Pholiota conissans]|uniref:Uncharacterized protein n=1 Tax=Pholiota conissans TaxID=109636 RepID=A0A9P5ZDL8_9AGAR|nr:hypothetical protein BDN70DRAFT_902486 [Pholiota conissans]
MNAQQFTLLRSFFGLTPPVALSFPSHCSINLINSFFVNDILLNPHFQQYPPSIQYQQRFWKWAIENLEELARKQESEACQICGKGVPLQGPPAYSFVTHFWCMPEQSSELLTSPNEDAVDVSHQHTATLLESRTMIESGTTGLRTWLASFVLAQHLILNPDLVASKRVLELGSGIGFLGIIIASLQQLQETSTSPSPSLWLTDVNDEVLARCRDNMNLSCNLSSRHQNIGYMKLDWSESLEENSPISSFINDKINPEVILGADIVFDPSLIPGLVRTIKISLQPSNCSATFKTMIIALTLRNEETMRSFLSHVRAESMRSEELLIVFETTPFFETVERDISCENVKLFRIITAT